MSLKTDQSLESEDEAIKFVTEASEAIYGYDARHGYVLNIV